MQYSSHKLGNLLGELKLITNWISLSRVILGFLFMYVASLGKLQEWYLFVIFILIGLSDFLDGYISRRFNMQSQLGCILDPLCDKIVILQTGIVFVFYLGVPLWLLIFLAIKDSFLILGGIYLGLKKASVIPANIWGKITSAVLSVLALVVLFKWAYFYPHPNLFINILIDILIGISVIFASISMISYVRIWKNILGREKN